MTDELTALERRWEHDIARDEARVEADEVLRIITTAFEAVPLRVGKYLWERACQQREDRAADAPLVNAIAAVEPRLSRASMYRAIAVYRQSAWLPDEVQGALGPARLYALCRLPNEHIEKKALARRAALSAMRVDEINAEIDGLLGVAARDDQRGRSFGAGVANLGRSAKALAARLDRFTPRSQRDLDARKAQVAAVLAELQAIATALDAVVVGEG
jgi:hypothetical protein